jgi:hypothetical protein
VFIRRANFDQYNPQIYQNPETFIHRISWIIMQYLRNNRFTLSGSEDIT